MPDVAFYALMRFVPDLERGEPINVGALAGSNDQLVVRIAGESNVLAEVDIVRRFAELLNYLIDAERDDAGQLDVQGFLHRLAYRRFSHFSITEPRQVMFGGSAEALAGRVIQALAAHPAASEQLLPI